MRTVFIVSVDEASTREQRDAFTNYLRTLQCGFWHQVSHLWIIVSYQNQFTARGLMAKLAEIMPEVVNMTLKVEPQDYAGLSVTTGHKWLSDYLR